VSDTIAVALITGGLSVASGLTGAMVAYRAARQQGEVTIEVARQAADVELRKVGAENERLREQRREDRRGERQDSYHQLIDAATKLWRLFGVAVEPAETEKLMTEYNWLIAGVVLYAPDSVRDSAYELNDIVVQAWEEAEGPERSLPDAEGWQAASAPHQDKMTGAINALVAVMRADVLEGVAGAK
jgi:hypothetical protein